MCGCRSVRTGTAPPCASSTTAWASRCGPPTAGCGATWGSAACGSGRCARGGPSTSIPGARAAPSSPSGCPTPPAGGDGPGASAPERPRDHHGGGGRGDEHDRDLAAVDLHDVVGEPGAVGRHGRLVARIGELPRRPVPGQGAIPPRARPAGVEGAPPGQRVGAYVLNEKVPGPAGGVGEED